MVAQPDSSSPNSSYASFLILFGQRRQATGLPQLKEGGILDIKSGFDVC